MLKYILSILFFALSVTGHVFIALKQHNSDILVEAFHNVSNPLSSQYGQYWSQDEINDLVSSPNEGAVEDLLIYFKMYGIDCVQMGGDAMVCDDLMLLCLQSLLSLRLIL